METNEIEKCCACCKTDKPLDMFRDRKDRPGQREPYCLDCRREKGRLSMIKRKEQNKEYHKKWAAEQRERECCITIKNKCCTCCGEDKPLDEFPPNKIAKDKKGYQCYSCVEKKMDIWKAKNWKKVLLRSCALSHRTYYNDVFELTEDFLQELYNKQHGKCHWLGIELLIDSNDNHPARPSIDRLDCSKGYTRDNVVMSSRFANLGRRDTEHNVFIEFLKQMKKV